MSRPAYPAYRDSGIEWLGEIPEHWEVWKVTRGFRGLGSGTTPKSDVSTYYDGHIPWVTTSELRETVIEDTVKKLTNQALQDYTTLRLYPPGTLLFAMYGATIGRMGLLGISATVNQACMAFTESITLDTKFTFYWLWMRRPILIVLSAGGGQPNLSQEDLRHIRIPAPPLLEQRAIAAFLDRETARIDTLIEKKKQQIELLQEKRSALISHAVTKGLNPNVKMKDSGIEWIGEIPEHWEVKRLRNLGYCQNGINIGAEYFGSGFPFVTYGDVYKNRELPTRGSGLVQSSSVDRGRYSVETGDMFFTRTSETIEEIGFASVCLSSINDAVFAGFLIRFRPIGSNLDTLFSKYYFQCHSVRAFFVKEMNLVTRASLSQDLLKQMPVLVPPKEEQVFIASMLDRSTRKTSSLIKRVEDSITLLREYRTALISAAVTGKIDVRKV